VPATTQRVATITMVGAELHLHAAPDPRLERIPGAKRDPRAGHITLPATTRTIHQLEQLLGPITKGGDAGVKADPLTLSLARAAQHHPDYQTPAQAPAAAPIEDALPAPTTAPAQPRLELEPPKPDKPLPDGCCMARVQGSLLLVDSPFEAKETLKAIPEARWNAKHRAWTYPATIQHLVMLKRALGDALRLDATAQRLVNEARAAKAAEREAAQHKSDASEAPDIPHLKTRAWRHQRQAFAFANTLKRAVLAMEMGTGKTLVSLGFIAENTERAAVVLAPKRVVRVWPAEIDKHLADPGQWHVLPLAEGPTAKRAKAIEAAQREAAQAGKRLLVAVNYEASHREPLAGALKRLEPDVVVLDEVHRIKSRTGKASKFAAALAAGADHRLGLTGTLIPNGPEDVWAQFRAIDPNLLGPWTQFSREHLVYNDFGGVAGYKDLELLHHKIDRRAYRVTQDVLDLPPVQHQVVPVDLKPGTRRLAREIYDELRVQLGHGSITTSIFLTKLLRVQQLTGGVAVLDDGTHEIVDTAKADALEDLLTDLPKNEPVVVFATFHDDLDAIERVTEKLGRRYAELSGRRDQLEAWQRGEADVIGIQTHAGGVGIDATRAAICVYYSHTYNYGAFEQSQKRVHRPGQTRPVRMYYLIATDSVDEDIHAALTAKKNLAEYVLERARRAKAA